MKKSRSRGLDDELRVIERCRAALEGRPAAARARPRPRPTPNACGASASCPPSRCSSCSTSTNRTWRTRSRPSNGPVSPTPCPAAGSRRFRSARRSSWRLPSCRPRSGPAFLGDIGLTDPGLDRVVRAGYRLLGYISFFTVGKGRVPGVVGPARHRGAGGGRRDPQRHRPGVHPRGSGPLRCADGAGRLARRLPRARRGAAGGQGLRGPRRRRHQLPVRHLIRPDAAPER